MALEASHFLFFLFFFLYISTVSTSGTLVGFSYDATRNSATSSTIETISFLKKNNVSLSQIRVFVADHRVLDTLSNTGVPVNLYLNRTQVENLRKSKASTISWLKTHLETFLPHVNITSIIVGGCSIDSVEQNELSLLLPTLKLIHSVLSSFDHNNQIQVSVAFPLSFLENLNRKHARDLQGIVDFIEKSRSFIVLEAIIKGELSMGDRFVRLMIERTISAATVLRYSDVSMVLTVRSSAIPSAVEVAEFTEKMTRSLEKNTKIVGRIDGLFAEIYPMEEFEQKELKREEEQMFPSSHRELINFKQTTLATKTTSHDMIVPATPITTASVNSTPTIITVPSTSPVNPTPTNPVTTPVTIPGNPVNPPVTVPATNPVTTPVTVPMAPPLTNPVTTPVTPPSTTPVTNPVPPSTTNSPAVLGQTWCLAKTGAPETALQTALDYACGIGGADCSPIQQKGSCYSPNTLQNHASYAFNSFYQKNPAPTSCDFGGTAVVVNTNPSTGSCVYTSASASGATPPNTGSSPPALNNSNPAPPTSLSPVLNTSYPTPPTTLSPVLNTSYPAPPTTTVFGSDPPPNAGTPVSISAGLKPIFGCIVFVASFVTENLLMGI